VDVESEFSEMDYARDYFRNSPGVVLYAEVAERLCLQNPA